MSKPPVKAVRKRPGCSGQPASYHFIEIVIAFAGSEADAVSNRARFERPLKQSIRTGTSLNFTSDILIELQISGFQLGIKGSCSATESRIDGLAIESRKLPIQAISVKAVKRLNALAEPIQFVQGRIRFQLLVKRSSPLITRLEFVLVVVPVVSFSRPGIPTWMCSGRRAFKRGGRPS